MKKALLYLSLLSIISGHLYAQRTYEVGTIPEFNFATSLSKLWALDVELAPRFELVSGEFGKGAQDDIYFGLLDITTVFNRTVGVDAKVGLGYLARFEEGLIAHRFIQQYSFTVPRYGYRIGHRFRVDETFTPDEDIEIRLRYRISSDISLNGEFIDPKELYLKLGNEYVYSFQGETQDLEIRFIPSLGYYFNDDNKLEVGMDYRVDAFLESNTEHRFWINVGYYLSL